MKTLANAGLMDRYFLTIQEVSILIGLSRSTITREEQKGNFPPRQKISTRRIGYQKDLVVQWMEGNWSKEGGCS